MILLSTEYSKCRKFRLEVENKVQTVLILQYHRTCHSFAIECIFSCDIGRYM